jgi:MoaA/NifB/PqqE/SkfB family radical SAM enzyme
MLIQTAMRILWGMMMKQPVPVALSWKVTERCNLNCAYCQGPQNSAEELTRDQIKNYMGLFYDLGTRRIHFTGGEALLRDDIGEIVDSAYARGIQTSLFTNGILLPQRYEEIKRVNQISISFDGSQPVHDAYRGEGSFDKAVGAIMLLKRKQHVVRMITTLHQGNLEQIPFILDFSKKHQVPVKFHFLLPELSGQKDITQITLDKDPVRRWVKCLIEAKRHFNIINSLSSLRYLENWPDTPFLTCRGSGQFLFHVSANGEIYACNMTQEMRQKLLPEKAAMIHAMRMVKPKGCARCWCTGTLDFNLLFTFKKDVVAGVIRHYQA